MINVCLQVLKVLMTQMVLIAVLLLMASNWTTLQSKTTFHYQSLIQAQKFYLLKVKQKTQH